MARRSIALLGAFAAAALAQAVPVAHPAQAAESRHVGRVVLCEEVHDRIGFVTGRFCTTRHRGPLFDLTIVRPRSTLAYHCERGWAEGHLWVRGEGCHWRPV